MITYRTDVRPDAQVVADLYRISPLRRPVDDVQRIARMYDGSNVVVTAWSGDQLVGILRGWTDNAFDGYICDLAVHPDFQKRGIGVRLLDRAREGKPEVQWILTASTIAKEYYSHLGWIKIENGWKIPRDV